MNFDWTEDQLSFKQAVIDFASNELADDLVRRDAEHEFNRDFWDRCAKFGFHGLPLPEEYGGQGADPLTTLLAFEALGYACKDNGLIFSINAHLWSGVMPVWRFGNEEQKAKWLPGLIDGTYIGVQGMTEPGTGSDAFSLATRAEEKDGSFVLNGSKIFITNAPVADVFIVFASTNPSLGSFGLSAFIVPADTPGVTVGQPFHKMGLRTSPMSELFFDDCTVPAADMLGKPGNGMAIFNHSIDWERAGILASAVGTMQRQLEESIAYANEREQFGQPIGKFQAVSHRIVDMHMRLESARGFLYRAGWAKQQAKGGVTSQESAMAKLAISEAWVQNSLDALQVKGGYGYMAESEIEREVRDAIASRIYSGTSDIQKNIVARTLGL